jgi:hypothetical protein
MVAQTFLSVSGRRVEGIPALPSRPESSCESARGAGMPPLADSRQTRMSAPPRKQTRMSAPPRKQTRMSAPPRKQTRMSAPPRKQIRMSPPPGKQTRMSALPHRQTRMSAPPRRTDKYVCPIKGMPHSAGRSVLAGIRFGCVLVIYNARIIRERVACRFAQCQEFFDLRLILGGVEVQLDAVEQLQTRPQPC